MDEFAFEATEEIFGHRVVIGICFAGHTLAGAIGLQASR